MNEFNTQLKYVLDGETVNRSTTVSTESNTVRKHHVTEHKTGKIECDWTFDFSGVTHAELLELASRDIVIKHRPKFKALKSSEVPGWINKTFSVREFLDNSGRSSLTDAEKASKLLAKMDSEEVAKILKEHGFDV